MNENDKKYLLDYLKDQILMSLGTTDGANLWSASVYFLADKDLNIYFMSGEHTVHVKNITEDSKVSLTIADSHQKPSGEKIGFQARGICEKVNDESWPKVLEKWNLKFSDRPASPEDMKERGSSFFKIKLSKIKFFNTNLTEKVLEFEL